MRASGTGGVRRVASVSPVTAAVVLAAACLVSLCLPAVAPAAPVPGWSAWRVTNDAVYQGRPFVWEDYAVWDAPGPAGDREVFLYDISSGMGSVISSQPGDDIAPDIDDGFVVWQWDDGHDTEIVLYNIATRTKILVTNNDRNDRYPRIDGRLVVYTAVIPGASEEICVYNIETAGTTRLTANLVADVAPDVQDGRPWGGGLVVWQQWDGHDYEIWCMRVWSPAAVRLTNNDYADITPRTGGGWVVWEGATATDSEIFATNPYSDVGLVQVTNDTVDDWAPHVEAGKMVWLKGVDPEFVDLYAKDLRFGFVERLTTAPDVWDDVPSIDLWRATWYTMWGTHPGTDSEIMLRQLLGGPAGTLSATFPDSQASSLSVGSAAWLCYDGHDAEVVVARAAFPFSDVSGSHPYRRAIKNLALMGVVAGRTATVFEPSSLLYRQQYAKMAVLGVGALVGEDDVCTFVDVDISGPGSLFPDNYVAAAQRLGLVLGTTPTTFSPYDNLTRAQAVTIAVRAAQAYASGGLSDPWGWMGLTSWYTDPPHAHNVHLAEANHLLDGIDLHSWNPDEYCRRGEAAQIIWNLWQRLAAPGQGGGEL